MVTPSSNEHKLELDYDWFLDHANNDVITAGQYLVDLVYFAAHDGQVPLGVEDPYDIAVCVDNLLQVAMQLSGWRKVVAERLHVPVPISIGQDDARIDKLDERLCKYRERLNK